MIIAFTGKRGSGKSTAAAYLVKQHEFELRAFADPLKKSIAAFFDVPYHMIEKWKNDPYMLVQLICNERSDISNPEDPFINQRVLIPSAMTFREALQRYGTESHRDIFGEDFWVDYTLPMPPHGFYVGRKIVIHDCRFFNEANRVRQLGGIVVDIQAAALPLQPQHRGWENHISEAQDFAKDYVIENDGNIRELYFKIERMLSAIDLLSGYERPS